MRLGIVAVCLALVVIPRPARAAEPGLCEILTKLAAEAATGEVIRIWFSNAVGGDVFTACGPTDTPLVRAYCADAIGSAGIHAFDRYPLRVRDCLRSGGVARITAGRRGSGVPGRPLKHLAATMGDRVRLDLTFAPASPDDDEGPWLYGDYNLVLWRP